MKYTKEYLEENKVTDIVKNSLGLGTQAGAALASVVAGAGKDILDAAIDKPKKFGQAVGDAKRRAQVRRSRSTFGSGGAEDSAKSAILGVLGGDPAMDLLRKSKNRVKTAVGGVVDSAVTRSNLRSAFRR